MNPLTFFAGQIAPSNIEERDLMKKYNNIYNIPTAANVNNYNAVSSPFLPNNNRSQISMANNRQSNPLFTPVSNRPNIAMANNRPVSTQKNTPPNYRDNLLNMILSTEGQGYAQGLLEAGGYSKMPIGFSQAMALGQKRANENVAREDAKNYREAVLGIKEDELGIKEKQIDATLEAAKMKQKNFVPLSKEEAVALGLNTEKSYQIDRTTNEIKQIGGGGVNVTVGDKESLAKTQSALSIVEKDADKFSNASSNKTAIAQMRSASESFKTGAFADTRIFAGQVADLIGLEQGIKNELINPSSGEAFKSAQNKLVRQLADGLVNLNKAELKMLQDNYPKVSNTREGNNLMFDIFEKEYETQEKVLTAIENYYSSDQTLKEYGNVKREIFDNYNKEVKGMLDEYTGGLDNFNKLMMDNIGKTGEGISVSGQVVNVSPEKTDEFIGLNENGMPTFKKKNGTQYTIADSE